MNWLPTLLKFALNQGIKFLGFKFYLTDTGKVIRKLSRENASKEKRKLRKLKNLVNKGTLTKEHVDECYNSWKAHAKRGNTHDLILSMDMYYKNLWKEGAEDNEIHVFKRTADGRKT